jgi:hypothetical protein|tara:strand:+ start:5528 stop:6940 length:1413 start_codon:yes stop_codon:yes gene_type:complete
MASIGSTRGTDLPNIDATSNRAFRISPETYTTVDTLIKTTKDQVMPDLVETYGEQGITGFLKLTGAINSGGSSDQIDWWEMGRRHKTYTYAVANITNNTTNIVVAAGDDSFTSNVEVNDVIMDSSTGTRYIVQAGGFSTGVASNVTMVLLNGNAAITSGTHYDAVGGEWIKLGNMYAQGTNQPVGFDDPGVIRRSNPFMIVKDRYEVNGSQATNIGWVNIGGGEYRWFMKGEQEARARFEDRRELMMLFGEKHSGTAGTALDNDLAGSEGYFSAIEDRGIQVSNAASSPMDTFGEFDDIILELDKQGAPSEYAMYLNRKQDLAIDDMLAMGLSGGVTTGLPGQFGAFNNDADMAVKLGFKSFTRGGYTFHKHDWKLLNDPTLLGTSNFIQGAMVPLSQVTDARSGMKAPALAMYYKEANGYNREMEHWVTGSILGHYNNGDVGSDNAVFHYRSEIALCVRAANQHVVIKG